MIHSTHSEFTAIHAGAPRTSRSSHSTHETFSAHGRPHVATGAWTFPSFAEPEISSLWDANLLDRLSVPLTRYHE
jgi:hypothetical protein